LLVWFTRLWEPQEGADHTPQQFSSRYVLVSRPDAQQAELFLVDRECKPAGLLALALLGRHDLASSLKTAMEIDLSTHGI